MIFCELCNSNNRDNILLGWLLRLQVVLSCPMSRPFYRLGQMGQLGYLGRWGVPRPMSFELDIMRDTVLFTVSLDAKL